MKINAKTNLLEGKEGKVILSFSLFFILGDLLQQLYNAVDSIILGRFVSTNALADLARSFEFPNYIRVGNSFSGDVWKANHLLEDVFEAFIGAMYLDQGFELTRKLLIDIFIGRIKAYDIEDSTDYKSKLQEEMQAEHRESVIYEVISETGPSHDRHFVVHVTFDGIELGVGEGTTKKEAEQLAAKAALEKEASK